MSTALAPTPHKSLSLFQITEEVEMLLDCAETVTPAQQEEYRRDLAEAMTRQTTKIDRVHGFMKHCQANAKAAADEIKRLQGVKKQYENAEQSMRDAVRTVLEQVVQPDNNGKRYLKSPLVSFSLRGNPPKVEIQNEEMVPSLFKTITITLPVDVWQRVAFAASQLKGCGGELSDAEVSILAAAETQAAISVDAKAVQIAIEQAVAEAETTGAPTAEDLAALVEEARRSVAGAYLPEKGGCSVVIR